MFVATPKRCLVSSTENHQTKLELPCPTLLSKLACLTATELRMRAPVATSHTAPHTSTPSPKARGQPSMRAPVATFLTQAHRQRSASTSAHSRPSSAASHARVSRHGGCRLGRASRTAPLWEVPQGGGAKVRAQGCAHALVSVRAVK